jgi:tetratricopeptide (TPR) repeat protein
MLRDRVLPIAGGALDEDAIPASIAALLAARIDALPANAKAVLLDASVVGKTFWSGAVAALSARERADVEPHLDELARRELIRPAYPSTMAGEAEYAFWHALLRDVAYGELTRGARLAKHRATAAWITDRAGAALGEDAEIVVAHLDRALELASATGVTAEVGAIQGSLVDALLTAADTAMRTEVPRALAHLRRLLELLAPEDLRRPDALATLGRALSASADYPEAVTALQEAAEILRTRGETRAAAELGTPLANALLSSGNAAHAQAVLSQARSVLERTPGPELVANLSDQAALRSYEEHLDALERAEDAIGLANLLGLPPPHRALMARGVARFPVDWAGAEADLRAAIDGAVGAGDLRAASVAFYNLATTRAEVVGPASGLAVFDEAISFSVAHGIPTEFARSGRVEVLCYSGGWDELLDEAEHVRAWARGRGDAVSAAVVDLAAARVRLERGESIGFQDELASTVRHIGYPASYGAPVVAEAAAAEGDAEAARRVLADALETTAADEVVQLARFVRACIRVNASALAWRALARAATPATSHVETPAAEAMLKEVDELHAAARVGYERAAASYEKRGEGPEQAYALAGLGRCLLALGEAEEGVARLHESRVIWERLKATPRIAEIDALLGSAE